MSHSCSGHEHPTTLQFPPAGTGSKGRNAQESKIPLDGPALLTQGFLEKVAEDGWILQDIPAPHLSLL